ncbi:MAG: Rrf2 family transcriptional regulator [Cyanobacteria bacterium J06639_1]
MQLSCKSEYALLALFELAQHYRDGEPQQIKAIAAAQDIPERYLEQLLAALRRQGLVRSQRGAKGGYVLDREPWQIDLYEVVQSIEGKESDTRSNASTPTIEMEVLHETWQEVQTAAEAALRKWTLQDLCDRKVQRQRGTVMYYI